LAQHGGEVNVPDGTTHCDYGNDDLDHEDLNCAEVKFQMVWPYGSDHLRLLPLIVLPSLLLFVILSVHETARWP